MQICRITIVISNTYVTFDFILTKQENPQSYSIRRMSVVVVVVLLFYHHGKNLRSSRDGQLSNHTFPGQA